MAVTAIWNITGKIGAALIYVENPEKTIDPNSLTNARVSEEDRNAIINALEYVTQVKKTSRTSELVTGIGCDPDVAKEEMIAVKKQFGKEGGNTAYHAYQSFLPGEATPEVAHKIGVLLAEEIWGGQFQVVVATHTDKDHIHNHFILNSVSYVDGKKYNDCKRTYWRIRNASDRLCREYGLSVIEDPSPGKAKHYSEWEAEKNGKPTWRSIAKADIDRFIREATSEKRFFQILRENGYTYKIGKDITVKPPGKERGVKLARNYGDGYTIDAIRRRIAEQDLPARPPKITPAKERKAPGIKRRPRKKVSGFMGLYIKYMYKLGILPKRSSGQNKKMHFLLREDIRYMNRLIESYSFLSREKIETIGQMEVFRKKAGGIIENLVDRRKELNTLNKNPNISEADRSRNASEFFFIGEKLKILRRELRLCNDIETRSSNMRGKLKTVNAESIRTNEEKVYGRINPSSRTNIEGRL